MIYYSNGQEPGTPLVDKLFIGVIAIGFTILFALMGWDALTGGVVPPLVFWISLLGLVVWLCAAGPAIWRWIKNAIEQ